MFEEEFGRLANEELYEAEREVDVEIARLRKVIAKLSKEVEVLTARVYALEQKLYTTEEVE